MNTAPQYLRDLFPDEKFHYWTALHEIGHALGFLHAEECLDAGECLDAELPDTASYDPDSIVVPSYDPATPETESKLSDGDKATLRTVYGPPQKVYWIEGITYIEGKDDEPWPFSDEYLEINRYAIGFYAGGASSSDPLGLTVAKWGDECRAEIDIVSDGVIWKNGDPHLKLTLAVDLFEGTTEESSDKVAEADTEFILPLDGREHTSDGANAHGPDGDYAKVHLVVKSKSARITGVKSNPAAPSAATATFSSTSDVNGDGQVNVTDMILVSNAFGQTGVEIQHLDVNGDGIVSIADLVQIAQHLTQLVNPAAPAHIVVPSGVPYETIQGWIDQARAADDGSLVFRRGIANLERLLTLIVPEKTALLPNYPNPFNPETWIPYHLAEPAEVTLTIYSIDGKVVRYLDLGHQATGYYQSKSRAAYWDGRNAVGERVASGIYFYTLKAGDFAATKKMLIRK